MALAGSYVVLLTGNVTQITYMLNKLLTENNELC